MSVQFTTQANTPILANLSGDHRRMFVNMTANGSSGQLTVTGQDAVALDQWLREATSDDQVDYEDDPQDELEVDPGGVVEPTTA